MESARGFAREREIFLAALEQPETVREIFVRRATQGDPILRSAVELLLGNYSKDDDFLEKPAAHGAGLWRKLNAPAGKSGDELEQSSVENYRIINRLGEGGCAVVFRAEQQKPIRRQVALKVIRLGMNSRSVVARFEAERQTLARMSHPNIASVFDAGVTKEGRPFFAMELVEGRRITEYVEEERLGIPGRIQLFQQLCHAVQHAHQKGVIHRDLKPSNVLVTKTGNGPVLKVIDFGIAKAVSEPLGGETTDFTRFDVFIGTPAYISPELAGLSNAADTRTDVYSLGSVLYELLAGSPPFDPAVLTRSGLEEMRRLIREVEPEKPSARRQRDAARALVERFDRDLDWIVLRCLEKDPARRYQTVQDLANDLEHCLRREPVKARPASTGYRLRKAFQRNQVGFLSAAAIGCIIVAATGLSTYQAVRATRAEKAAEFARKREERLRRRAESERQKAVESRHRAELNAYVADINLAHQAWEAGNLGRASTLLERHTPRADSDSDPRGFEWAYVWNLAQGSERKQLARAPGSVFSLATSRFGNLAAFSTRDAVFVYDSRSGEKLREFPVSGGMVEFSGDHLVIGNMENTRIINVDDWSETRLSSAFSSVAPDGKTHTAGSGGSGTVELQKEAARPVRIRGAFPPFKFSPDGEILLGNTPAGLALWDARSGKQLRVLPNSASGFFRRPEADRQYVSFSPDGRYLAVARMSPRANNAAFGVDVWDTATGAEAASLPTTGDEGTGHIGRIAAIAFSPDSKWIATASWDHSVRVWDVATRRRVSLLKGNLSEVWAVAFSSDGKLLLTGSKDGSLLVWPVSAQNDGLAMRGDCVPLKFSKDGSLLAAIRDGRTLVIAGHGSIIFEAELRPPGERPRAGEPNYDYDFDQRRLAYVTREGRVAVRDLENDSATELRAENGRIESVTFAPNGNSVVGRTGREALTEWNLITKEAKPIAANRIHFSNGGNQAVLTSEERFTVRNWKTGAAERTFETGTRMRTVSALSLDGKVLAVACDPQGTDNSITLWNTESGKTIGRLLGHTQGVWSVALSPDGRTAASSGTDGTLRVWNVATQQELFAEQQLGGGFDHLVFAPNGQRLAVQVRGGQSGIRIFEAAEAK